MDSHTTLRTTSAIVGAFIIGCVTYATVKAIGGIYASMAPTIIALACGLVVGALAFGIAWSQGRKVLAIAIAVTMICGEAYTLLNTGERELEAREAKQAPVRAAMVERERLSREVQAPVITTTPRLQAAQANLDAINTDARIKIATASCIKLCKQELAEQRAAAMQEVADARAELNAMRTASAASVDATKAALAALPAVAAASPLAARINVPDWVLDLIRAGLFSVSANGLGAFLLAFASHDGRRRESFSVSTVSTVSEPKGLSFERPDGDYTPEEIDELTKILNAADRPLTNNEVAAALRCHKSWASKLVQAGVESGKVTKLKVGRFNAISLVA